MKTHRRVAAARHHNVDDATFALSLAAFAATLAVLVGTADSSAVAGPPSGNGVAATSRPQSSSGDPKGVYADGAPIYRIPGVTVSASRAVELARIERESRSARVADAGAGAS